MKHLLPLCTLLIMIFLYSCTENPITSGSMNTGTSFEPTELKSSLGRNPSPVCSNDDVKQLVSGNTDFALKLYQKCAVEKGNLIFCPYSISSAFAMTYAGAAGETEQQIQSTLSYPFGQDKIHSTFNGLDIQITTTAGLSGLHMVNALWSQKDSDFIRKYIEILTVNYGMGIHLVDFMNAPEESRTAINQWVSCKTQNTINDLIGKGIISVVTRMVLTNTVSFYSQWKYTFNKELTKTDAFTLADNRTISVPYMTISSDSTTEGIHYAANDNYQAVELPYKGNGLSMVLLLPSQDNLQEFEESITSESVSGILSSFSSQAITVTLPKFTIAFQIHLKDALSDMGMPLPFSQDADFSNINGEKDIFIEEVIHKAFLSIDENGTQASAASAVVLDRKCEPDSITFNRPFIFLIKENSTGTILFIGRILDPLQ